MDTVFLEIRNIAYHARVKIAERLIELKTGKTRLMGRFSLTEIYKPDLEPVTCIEWPESEDLDYENPIIGIFQSQGCSEFNFMLKDGS